MEMEQLGGKIKKVGATSPLSQGVAYADTLDNVARYCSIFGPLDETFDEKIGSLYLINFCIRVNNE